jgi:hypothetical protein
MNSVTPERINQTLDVFRAFLRGDRREPLLTVHAAPDYRQETNPDVMVEKACVQIRADAASGEPHVLPTFWADLWGGTILPGSDGGGVHIEPVAPTLSEVGKLAVRHSFDESD